MKRLIKILKLTGPLLLSYFSYHILGITDVLMVGRLGTEAIAAVGIALTVLWFLIVPMEGILGSTLIHLSRAFGALQFARLKRFLNWELLLAIILGSLLIGLFWPLKMALSLYTQDSKVLSLAISYLGPALLGVVPYCINWVLTRFVLSVQKTLFMGIVSNLTVALNIFLNWVLIFGVWGFPALGVAGAAWATFISRIFQLIIYGFYTAILLRGLMRRGITDTPPSHKEVIWEIFQVGTPLGVTAGVEVGGWVVFVNLISRLGTPSFAAHEISMKVKDLAFLPCYALGEITTNLVGECAGQQDPEEGRKIVLTTFGLGVAIMSVFSVLFLVGAEVLIGFFTQDREALALSSALLRIMALYQIFDGIFIILRGALYGLKDIKFVRNIMFIGWWVILLPLAWLFAYPLGWGVSGAWLAFLGFAGFAALVFWFRFLKLLPKIAQALS